MFNARLIHFKEWPDQNAMVIFPVASTWLRALSQNIRHWFESSASLAAAHLSSGPRPLLFVWNPRMPDWFWNFDWLNASRYAGIWMLRYNLDSRPVLDQIRFVSNSSGIVSIDGNA